MRFRNCEETATNRGFAIAHEPGCQSHFSRLLLLTESVSVTSGIASRYAAALFELALDEGDIESLPNDISGVRSLLNADGGFRQLITSPVYTRSEMASAITAISKRIGLGQFMHNCVALMALKRRLFALPAMVDHLESLLDAHRRTMTAEIVAARELTAEELANLQDVLRDVSGKNVRFEVRVDTSLIGGIAARLGSRLVDSTVKTKLKNLKNALKEAE